MRNWLGITLVGCLLLLLPDSAKAQVGIAVGNPYTGNVLSIGSGYGYGYGSPYGYGATNYYSSGYRGYAAPVVGYGYSGYGYGARPYGYGYSNYGYALVPSNYGYGRAYLRPGRPSGPRPPPPGTRTGRSDSGAGGGATAVCLLSFSRRGIGAVE